MGARQRCAGEDSAGLSLAPAELRMRRLALGRTQAALGAALGVAGNTVARWERGERRIANPELIRLALERLEAEAASSTGHRQPSELAHDSDERVDIVRPRIPRHARSHPVADTRGAGWYWQDATGTGGHRGACGAGTLTGALGQPGTGYGTSISHSRCRGDTGGTRASDSGAEVQRRGADRRERRAVDRG